MRTPLERAVCRFERAREELRAAAAELRRITSESLTATIMETHDLRRVTLRSEELAQILRVVCSHHNILPDELLGRGKEAKCADARMRAMTIAQTLLQLSDTALVRAFGRTYAMARHARDHIHARCDTCTAYRADYERLVAACREAIRSEMAA